MQHGWCMKIDIYMSHSPPNQVPQCEGGDAEAGTCDYGPTHAILGQRTACASY